MSSNRKFELYNQAEYKSIWLKLGTNFSFILTLWLNPIRLVCKLKFFKLDFSRRFNIERLARKIDYQNDCSHMYLIQIGQMEIGESPIKHALREANKDAIYHFRKEAHKNKLELRKLITKPIKTPKGILIEPMNKHGNGVQLLIK